MGNLDRSQGLSCQSTDDEKGMLLAGTGKKGNFVTVRRPGDIASLRRIDFILDVLIPEGVTLGDVLEDRAVSCGDEDDIDVAVLYVCGQSGHDIARGREGVGEGKVIRIQGKFGPYRQAVIFWVFPQEKIPVFLAEVFLEFVVELFRILVEGPLNRVLPPYPGVAFQGPPELSDSVFPESRSESRQRPRRDW